MKQEDCRKCDGFKSVAVWTDDRTYHHEKCDRCVGTGTDPDPPVEFDSATTSGGGDN